MKKGNKNFHLSNNLNIENYFQMNNRFINKNNDIHSIFKNEIDNFFK